MGHNHTSYTLLPLDNYSNLGLQMISFKKFASRLVSLPRELIFRERMGLDAANLLRGTSYVAIGSLFGSLLTHISTSSAREYWSLQILVISALLVQ